MPLLGLGHHLNGTKLDDSQDSIGCLAQLLPVLAQFISRKAVTVKK